MPEHNPPIVPPPIVPPPVIDAGHLEVQFDENGCINQTLACRGCGYNLQGLHPESMCPECGTSIVRSIHGDKLRYSDPAWISRLARGTRWIMVGLFLSIPGGMFISTLLALLSSVGTIPRSSMEVVGAILGAGLSMITIIGVWWLTSPDPGQNETESQFSARVIARWCILASLLQVPLQVLGYQPGLSNLPNPGTALTPTIMIMSIAAVLMRIIVIIGYVAILKYLARLADRIPHVLLIRNCRIVMWGLGITIGLMSIFQIALLMYMQVLIANANAANLPASMFPPVIGIVFGTCIFAISMFVFTIWGIVLLFRFNSAFKNIAHEAGAIWQASVPTKPDSMSPGGE
ncbi:MAG: hypothetical protein IID30_12990 [Planctomycetes bacterium]|nr:hypothetical protein [Planctomycetota bacterium]